MATISDYLTQLQTDKQTLVDNLVEKGVEATSDETFTSLVPKVLDVPSGDVSEYFNTETTQTFDYIVKTLPKITYTGTSNMYGFFKSYKGLEKMPELEFTKLTSFSGREMFYGLSKLKDISNLSKINIPINDMQSMFSNCSSLEDISAIASLSTADNMSTYYSSMCYSCRKLKSFPSINLINATYVNEMFYGCSSLEIIPELDFSNVTSLSSVLSSCSSLTSFGGFKNIGQAYTKQTENYSNYTLVLASCTKLSHDSLMNVINNLYDLNLTYDVANGGTLYTQKLTLGSTNLAKLTEEEIAIATNKGWTVS